ncbi:hypothetical protein THAOC_06856, partial [Thalassiosira oceanica]
ALCDDLVSIVRAEQALIFGQEQQRRGRASHPRDSAADCDNLGERLLTIAAGALRSVAVLSSIMPDYVDDHPFGVDLVATPSMAFRSVGNDIQRTKVLFYDACSWRGGADKQHERITDVSQVVGGRDHRSGRITDVSQIVSGRSSAARITDVSQKSPPKDDGQRKKGWACPDTRVALRAPTAQPRDGVPSRKGRGVGLGLCDHPQTRHTASTPLLFPHAHTRQRSSSGSPGSAATMGGSSRSSSIRNDASASWSRSTKSIQSEATDCASSHAQSKSVSIESNGPEVYLTASMVSRVAETSHESSRSIHTPGTHTTAAHDEGSLEEKCSESESDSTAYDTIGLRSSDKPTSGGVARDAAKSIGVVSEITAPLHYIPTPSISVPGVPQEMNLLETTIKANSTPKANLLAGLKAADYPGQYVTAAEYLAFGRKQIGPSGWETDKPLSLQLYSEGACLAYRTGDISTMEVLLGEVLSRPDLTVMEKFRAYEIKIIARQSAEQFQESLTIGLDVLKQLGLHVLNNKPRSKLAIAVEYTKTKRALGKRTAKELASLPRLTDERIGMGLRISELLLTSCYQAQPTMFPLLVFRMVRATLKHGINVSSSDAFVSYAVILCGAFREPQRGREMAKAGELIIEQYGFKKSRATLGDDGLIYYWTAPLLDTLLRKGHHLGVEYVQSRFIYVAEGLVYHWTKPFRDSLEALREGNRLGMECGDIESAGFNLELYLARSYFSGCQLWGNAVIEFIDRHIEYQNTDGVDSQQVHTTSEVHIETFFLALKKLSGVEIQEDERDFDGILAAAKEMGNQSLYGNIYLLQLGLKVFFGEWEEAAEMLNSAGNIHEALFLTFAGLRWTILEALISIKATRLSKKMPTSLKWRRRAYNAVKRVRCWAKKNNPNIEHSLHLIEAELASLKGNKMKAIMHYRDAIDTAEKNGFLQDQALSNELASLYFGSIGDSRQKSIHRETAIRCYSEWGAAAKVQQLLNSDA